MSESGMVSGAAGRYATALFELAVETKSLEDVSRDVAALAEQLAASPELTSALGSQAVTRAEAGRIAAAVADQLELGATTKKFLGLMAAKRRLGELPRALAAFETLAAEHRGEATVAVTAAAPLTDEQRDTLSSALRKAAGKTIHMSVTVDPELIGGLIVRMGSKMIDASIRSKLSALQHAMKEVG